MAYTVEQVMAMPLPELIITDTQVCIIQHASRDICAPPLPYISPCSPQITSACRSSEPRDPSEPLGVYPPIFRCEGPKPGKDTRLTCDGPYPLRATTITLEDCTESEYVTTLGLKPSALATCATDPKHTPPILR